MQRLFSTFPGGWPGIGLLLLRGAVGITAVIQGGIYLTGGGDPTIWSATVGGLAILGGGSLLAGFATPVAGAMIGFGAVVIRLSWFPQPVTNLFDAPLPTFLVVVVATAVAFLGPGALSVDARLFGRREIIIPHHSRPTKF